MRLLAALDLRERPDRLLEEVAGWALRLGGPVDLVFVDEFYSSAAYIEEPHLRKMVVDEWEARHRHDRADLEDLLERLPPDRRGRIHLLTGSAARNIVELGRDFDAILIGTHGRTGMAHFWLGSVAERVVRSATVPVIVLRVPAKG